MVIEPDRGLRAKALWLLAILAISGIATHFRPWLIQSSLGTFAYYAFLVIGLGCVVVKSLWLLRVVRASAGHARFPAPHVKLPVRSKVYEGSAAHAMRLLATLAGMGMLALIMAMVALAVRIRM